MAKRTRKGQGELASERYRRRCDDVPDNPSHRVSDMSPKQKVIELAKKLNVSVETGGGRHFEVVLTAPPLKIFAGTQSHQIVDAQWDDEPTVNCWKTALSDLSEGLKDCQDPQCEWCNPLPVEEIGS